MGTRKRANPADEPRTSYIVLYWATGITKALLDSEEYDDYEPAEVLQIGFAMANAMAEKQGLRVPGTNKLTPAGKKREREMLKHRPAEQIEAAYAALAKDTRHNYSASDVDRARAGEKNLVRADLRGADLRGVNLSRADLRRADLRDAVLTKANLYDAKLYGADLTKAVLTEAVLHSADLTKAVLTEADLTEADLTEADLTEADLTGAVCDDAHHNKSTVWPAGFKPPRKTGRAYGVLTGPVLKFGKPDVSYRAQDFKRRYPQEFDLLKRKTGVTDFSPQFAENLRQTNITPYDWIITRGRYGSTQQRLCPGPNFVLLLNINMDDEPFTEQQKSTLRGLTATSRRSAHPHESDPLFTVGWVRICRDDVNGVWLVEEVQSDLQVVRQQKKNKRLDVTSERLDEITNIMQPYADRFYQDALGITLIEAEKLGYEVEMLTHETKAKIGANPPRDVYKDLPLSMGISDKRKSKVLPDLTDEVRWTRPNPPKRR